MDLFGRLRKDLPGYVALGDKIVIGVSGGPDSVALAHFLKSVSAQYNLKLCVAHFNHMLRGKESAKEALFVKKLSAKLGLPFITAKKDIKRLCKQNKGGTEKVARDERFAFLVKTCQSKKFNKIAVAHNKDDNAETVLFRFLKGAGAEGLTGIPARRRLAKGEFGFRGGRQITVIRPLIGAFKKEILELLKHRGFEYCIDKSNMQDIYERNKIRNKVIPAIEKINPSFRESAVHMAAIMEAENVYLENEAKKYFSKFVKKRCNGAVINTAGLRKIHPGLRARVIRQILKATIIHHRKITYNLIHAVEANLKHRGSVDLPEGLRFITVRNTSRISR